jgi:hypothetical protein
MLKLLQDYSIHVLWMLPVLLDSSHTILFIAEVGCAWIKRCHVAWVFGCLVSCTNLQQQPGSAGEDFPLSPAFGCMF